MSQNIQEAPHGMNLVIETKTGRVVIGRFDQSNGFEVVMHDADVFEPAEGAEIDPGPRARGRGGLAKSKRRDHG